MSPRPWLSWLPAVLLFGFVHADEPRPEPEPVQVASPMPAANGEAGEANGNGLADRLREEGRERPWWSTAGSLAALSLLYGGMESLAAVAPEHWGVLQGIEHRRQPGSTLLSPLRLDALYQSVDNDLDAFDVRLEAGFGPLALQARRTWFDGEERDTGELQLTQAHLLYRMQFLGRIGLDVGFGPAVLDGVHRYEALSWTTPLQIRLHPQCTVELRPMWVTFDGSNVRDYEWTAVIGGPHFGVKAGYRWLKNDDQPLEAPVVGLSLRW